MVSRRKILSRSRDELHSDIYFMNEDDDEDVWYSKEKLYRVSEFLTNFYKWIFDEFLHVNIDEFFTSEFFDEYLETVSSIFEQS